MDGIAVGEVGGKSLSTLVFRDSHSLRLVHILGSSRYRLVESGALVAWRLTRQWARSGAAIHFAFFGCLFIALGGVWSGSGEQDFNSPKPRS